MQEGRRADETRGVRRVGAIRPCRDFSSEAVYRSRWSWASALLSSVYGNVKLQPQIAFRRFNQRAISHGISSAERRLINAGGFAGKQSLHCRSHWGLAVAGCLVAGFWPAGPPYKRVRANCPLDYVYTANASIEPASRTCMVVAFRCFFRVCSQAELDSRFAGVGLPGRSSVSWDCGS